MVWSPVRGSVLTKGWPSADRAMRVVCWIQEPHTPGQCHTGRGLVWIAGLLKICDRWMTMRCERAIDRWTEVRQVSWARKRVRKGRCRLSIFGDTFRVGGPEQSGGAESVALPQDQSKEERRQVLVLRNGPKAKDKRNSEPYPPKR
ncbi:hypothetical protein TREMEDRAFT_64985 [Tremella mesenterica DSM 1558]|uniref:uncharacterized protein n=1 Tax=Tremella mesenterica (strain ATCC 24925 / CBS 8224 / DSM 1558 / NBRC 9311 / NRRL Y-6157 / RJB 2259-6 / UBC 559-6) TaxID=578456 RepID=UPI0003F493B2|nr:uncharacterized protein TREMEDRAFT_64985 [Tremella mesenterica DSM 1558]EIW67116.1 hypothetical protein TREMEDRAFT_64985 [Tremella mesenterica DSM 1558]